MTQRITFFAITACTLFLVACNKQSDVSSAPPVAAPSSGNTTSIEPGEIAAAPQAPELTLGGVEPAKEDVLLRYYGDDPDTLNLITGNDNVSSEFQRQVYDGLASRAYGDPSQWESHLAESWEFDEDNLEYIIHLRQGVKWHPITLPNGKVIRDKEFTANDVTFTFACVLNRHVEAASLRSYYSTVDPDTGEETPRIVVTKIDDYTVSVKWTEPYFMADEFTLAAAVMPRHVYSVDGNGEPISFDFASKEFADGFNNHWANTTMCGTGPMIFKEWKKGEQVVLERNPDFYGEPFYFSKIVFQFISNPNTARQKALQNDLDLASYSEADHFIEDQDHPNVKDGKVRLESFRRTAYRYLGYNLRRPVFEDKNVRMALSYAVPVDDIIQQIYHGLAMPMTGPFLPGGQFCNNDIKPVPFDLDKARQMLDEAGWKDTNENGIRDKMIDGKLVEFTFDLMIYADSPQYLSIAEIIKANFRKVGVDVQISPGKWALMLQKLRKKEFDATILGWVSDWKSDPYQIWHGSQADLPESSNAGGYKNPEVDKLIDQLRITMKEEEQITLYHEIHRLIYEDQPYTFLYLDKAMIGVHSRLQNLEFYPMLRPHMDAREWSSSSPRLFGK
ncbi:MAG: ABC transporter substrate-binding protein [Planctomycetota bacterium]|nr:ABC transporter substrate-binding protein [Planctomycetota bacterium]